MRTLQEFLNSIPDEDHRARLEHLAEWVTDNYPQLKLEIKWNQPMFTHDGTFILSFSASTNHFSVAPERKILDEFRDRLDEAGYSHSKALFRVQWTDEINYALFEDLIERSIEFKKGFKTFWAP